MYRLVDGFVLGSRTSILRNWEDGSLESMSQLARKLSGLLSLHKHMGKQRSEKWLSGKITHCPPSIPLSANSWAIPFQSRDGGTSGWFHVELPFLNKRRQPYGPA